MKRLVGPVVGLVLGTGCAPNLQGYWDITAWSVTRPDGVVVEGQDVGWVEFDDQGLFVLLCAYDYRGGEALVPLSEAYLLQDAAYVEDETEQSYPLPGFVGVVDLSSRAPRRLVYESTEETYQFLPTFPEPLEGSWSASYTLERS